MAQKMKLGLITCGKTKGPTATIARDLYQGDLFKKSLRYAMQNCDAVVILSAKYGLVSLDQIIEPYEMTLNAMPITERRRWASLVNDSLAQQFPTSKWTYVYLAGARYLEGLPKGQDVMRGLSFGRRLAWLNQHIKEE